MFYICPCCPCEGSNAEYKIVKTNKQTNKHFYLTTVRQGDFWEIRVHICRNIFFKKQERKHKTAV